MSRETLPWCHPGAIAKSVREVREWERAQARLPYRDRIRRGLRSPDPIYAGERHKAEPDPPGFNVMALTLEEMKFMRWLLKTHGRMPHVGEPGYRSQYAPPNYYLGYVRPDPYSTAAKRDMVIQGDVGPLDSESRGKANPDPLHESRGDPVIRAAFPDPDLEPGGWGGGYSIVTRPAAPKAPEDRPAATAGWLLDDAFARSGNKPVLTSDLRELAFERGISWSTIVREGKDRGIVPFKPKGSRGRWYWPAPKQEIIAKGG